MEIEEKQLRRLIEKEPRNLKVDFLMRSGFHKIEALRIASEREINDWAVAGCEATGFKYKHNLLGKNKAVRLHEKL